MLFLFNNFLPLKSFSLYIASFELENCQIDSNLSFDITNESLRSIINHLEKISMQPKARPKQFQIQKITMPYQTKSLISQ